MSEHIQAVLFDLDGTLVNSVPQLTAGVNALMRVVRRPSFTETEIASMVGKGVGVLIERVCQARGIEQTPQIMKTMREHYLEIMQEISQQPTPYFDGVRAAIERLQDAGIATALVTNKMRLLTDEFLQKSRSMPLFELVLTGDDVTNAKPAPEMLLRAAYGLNIPLSACLMVGDSRNDALAAKAAGMRVALVRTGYNENEPIDQWAQANGFCYVRDSVVDVVADVLAKRIPELTY